MAKLGINTGITPDDGTGDSLRSGAQIINSNFDELYTFLGDGSNLTYTSIVSIANTWSGSTVGIYTSKNVGIGTTNPVFSLTVAGSGTSTSNLYVTNTSTFYNTITGIPTSSGVAALFSGSTSNDLVRITQTGSGNALLVEDSSPDTTPFVITGFGSVGVGTANPPNTLTITGSGTSTSQLFNVGVSTFIGFSSFRDYVYIEDGLTLSGSGATSTTLNVTGVSTFVGFSSFNDYVFVQDGLNVSGATTSINLNVSGIASFSNTVTINSSGINISSGIITASNLVLTSGSVGFSTHVVLTSGTSWTVPSGVNLIKVYATGGGAGGTFNYGGLYVRGGGGGTAIRYYAVSPGGVANYTIGAGGLGDGTGSFYGAAGGNTTFTYGLVTITGTGGNRGNSNPLGVSQGSNGQINLYGGYPAVSTVQAYVSGGVPQATGYGLGGGPTGANGQQGAIIIEY